MSNTYRWYLDNIHTDSKNIITKIDWSVSVWSFDNSHINKQFSTDLPSPVGNPIAYDNLTKDQVWGFVFSAIGKTQAELISEIDAELKSAMTVQPIKIEQKSATTLSWMPEDGTGY